MTAWRNHLIDNWFEPFLVAFGVWLNYHPAILAIGGL